jgi:SAM-dependent methyltransferase
MSEPAVTSDLYIHGTHAEEQQRMVLMNSLLNRRMLPELGLRGGERVLDVGCGPGLFTREIARVVAPGGGRVIAVDRDAVQLAEARRQAAEAGEGRLVEFRQGEAARLPLEPGEPGSFDLVHARFLLEHLRDPLAAVREMAKAARPGGRVILSDDDHELLRVWPEPPGFVAAWNAYMRAYDRAGNDALIGRRLVELAQRAGLRPRRGTQVFFGGCAGDAAYAAALDNMRAILVGARSTILAADLLPGDVFDVALSSLEAWRDRPDGALWYAIPLVEAARD